MLNFKNIRTAEQMAKMKELKAKKICLFCEKNAGKKHGHPIEFFGTYWNVSKNDFPYVGTKVHYLIIYKKHISNISQINPKSAGELIKIMNKLSKENSLPGASFFMRFGNMDYTGSSIEHLHAHMISGSKQSKKTDPIMTTLGWNKK